MCGINPDRVDHMGGTESNTVHEQLLMTSGNFPLQLPFGNRCPPLPPPPQGDVSDLVVAQRETQEVLAQLAEEKERTDALLQVWGDEGGRGHGGELGLMDLMLKGPKPLPPPSPLLSEAV